MLSVLLQEMLFPKKHSKGEKIYKEEYFYA